MPDNFVLKVQILLNYLGADPELKTDGELGPKTSRALEMELGKHRSKEHPIQPPPWYTFAKKFEGKKETDPEFNKLMSSKWKLVGLNLGTIAKSWAAWCGLAMAVALSSVGIDYAKDGARARNWGKYGVEVKWKEDGIPRGAIIHINNAGKCNSSESNHVTQANGDCSAKDLLRSGATFDGYGGNQGNAWKVSTYSVSKICHVRWPPDYPVPGKIEKSDKCTSGYSGAESTQ